MDSIVLFGEAFDAERLVSLNAPVHLVFSGSNIVPKPFMDIMNEIIDSGLTAAEGFTTDPRALDYEHMEYTNEQKVFFQQLFPDDKEYEKQLKKAGLKNKNAYTCTLLSRRSRQYSPKRRHHRLGWILGRRLR